MFYTTIFTQDCTHPLRGTRKFTYYFGIKGQLRSSLNVCSGICRTCLLEIIAWYTDWWLRSISGSSYKHVEQAMTQEYMFNNIPLVQQTDLCNGTVDWFSSCLASCLLNIKAVNFHLDGHFRSVLYIIRINALHSLRTKINNAAIRINTLTHYCFNGQTGWVLNWYKLDGGYLCIKHLIYLL